MPSRPVLIRRWSPASVLRRHLLGRQIAIEVERRSRQNCAGLPRVASQLSMRMGSLMCGNRRGVVGREWLARQRHARAHRGRSKDLSCVSLVAGPGFLADRPVGWRADPHRHRAGLPEICQRLRRHVTPSDRLEPVEAHQRTGHQHEREPPPRVPVPAHLQPPEAAQPRQRPLDLPPVAPKLG